MNKMRVKIQRILFILLLIFLLTTSYHLKANKQIGNDFSKNQTIFLYSSPITITKNEDFINQGFSGLGTEKVLYPLSILPV